MIYKGEEIKNVCCPGCNSEDIEFIDTKDGEYNFLNQKGRLRESYKCEKCEEYFYIYIDFKIEKVETR